MLVKRKFYFFIISIIISKWKSIIVFTLDINWKLINVFQFRIAFVQLWNPSLNSGNKRSLAFHYERQTITRHRLIQNSSSSSHSISHTLDVLTILVKFEFPTGAYKLPTAHNIRGDVKKPVQREKWRPTGVYCSEIFVHQDNWVGFWLVLVICQQKLYILRIIRYLLFNRLLCRKWTINE